MMIKPRQSFWSLPVYSIATVCTVLMLGCTYDNPVQQNTSADVSQNSATLEGNTMDIEGTITAVMESWPLQLSVKTADGIYDVDLTEETAITRSGQPLEPGQLSPELNVVITGTALNPEKTAMSADTITVLETD